MWLLPLLLLHIVITFTRIILASTVASLFHECLPQMLTRSLAFALCLSYTFCLQQRSTEIRPRHRYPAILDFITQSLRSEQENPKNDQSLQAENNPQPEYAADLQYGTFDSAEKRQNEEHNYRSMTAKNLPRARSVSFWKTMEKRSLKAYDDPVCSGICQECSRWLTLSLSSLCWLDCQKGGHAFDQCILVLTIVKNQE